MSESAIRYTKKTKEANRGTCPRVGRRHYPTLQPPGVWFIRRPSFSDFSPISHSFVKHFSIHFLLLLLLSLLLLLPLLHCFAILSVLNLTRFRFWVDYGSFPFIALFDIFISMLIYQFFNDFPRLSKPFDSSISIYSFKFRWILGRSRREG